MSEEECFKKRICNEMVANLNFEGLESKEESMLTCEMEGSANSFSSTCIPGSDYVHVFNELVTDALLLKQESPALDSLNLEIITSETRQGHKRKFEGRSSSPFDENLSENILHIEQKDSMKSLKEEDVGITEFISDLDGFSGTIKQRYSDFIVNEIDSEGQTVHLTDLSVPNSPKSCTDVPEGTVLNSLVSEENLANLHNLIKSKDKMGEVLLPVDCDKELRGKLHVAIKSNFPDFDSNTIDRDGAKYIQVRFRNKTDSIRQTFWKKSTGNYCKFVLYKENKDTLEAINIISKFLRVSPKVFTFAGTKDRRAKTTQEVTAYRIEPSRLNQLNNCLKSIVLGNFSICRQQLKLGDLLGNHFRILLRNVLGSDEEIEKSMISLRDHGFINYYGMQRFGTTRIPTHWVGRALLCGNWSLAVDLILKPREGDRDEVSRARDIWWSTKDPGKALQELRNYQCIERKLLEGLNKHAKNDLVSALSWIPYNMRLMYIHAYQSFLWNRVVSRRIRQFGLCPVVGDLMIKDSKLAEIHDGCIEKIPAVKMKRDHIEPVEVTQQNLSEFNITDVVLPLPGYGVSYPNNEVKSWFNEMLKEDGLENFNFKHQVRDYSLPGGYRKIVIIPNYIEWEIMYYNDYQVSLIHGDLDAIKNSELPDKLSDGKFKAVKLGLDLPSSSYATMALREILKSGTSSAYHATLNVT